MLVAVWTPVAASGDTSMSKSSATIQVGDTYQLNALYNGTVITTAAWASNDPSVASVSSSGLVTGKAAGSAVITAIVGGTSVECVVSVVKRSTNTTTRYSVLILDASDSVKGEPLKYEKDAAKRFCKAVLNTSGENYLAVISLNKNPKVVSGFTNNLSALNKKIDSIKVSAHTNINDAFKKADELLSGVPNGEKVMKNVILCSDGIPNKGGSSASGRYKSSQHKYYKYANTAYKTDVALKNKGYFIYALGFFHNSEGKDLTFGKKLMKDLASKDKYFVVTKTKDIDNVFNKIANKVTETTINKSELTLYVGDTYNLSVKVDGELKSASWKSSKSSVASVSSTGKVTAKKKGTATITATVNGQKITCKVNVKNRPLTINKKSATIYVGQTLKLSTTMNGKKISSSWSSSKKSVATVSSKGVVTGKKTGKTTITAKSGGQKVTCTVTVKKPTIKLSKSTASIYVGESLQLNAVVQGKSQKVTWKTSNKKVATVSKNGKVYGRKEGKVTITATANGVKAKCVVTVKLKHPDYSQFFMLKKQKTSYGNEWVNEYGARLVLNEGAEVEKCAIYLEKKGSYYYRTFAVKGKNITSVRYVPYLGYNGKVLYDGLNTYRLNTYYLKADSNGVWSYDRNYELFKANVLSAVKSQGVDGKNTKIFYDLDKMKKWMNS